MADYKDAVSDEVGLGLDVAAVGCHAGINSHKDNQDNYWPHPPDTQMRHNLDYVIAGRLYIVADGVSGGLDGAAASRQAVEVISTAYYDALLKRTRYPTQDDIVGALRTALLEANRELLKRSEQERSEKRLADAKSYLQTTAVCAVLRGRELIVASVNDSRLYRLRQAKAGQPGCLSRVPLLGKAGGPVAVEILSEGANGPLPAFLGANVQPEQIYVFRGDLAPGDVLVLCSDGLYKYLDEENDPAKAGEILTHIYLKAQAADPQTRLRNIGEQLVWRANEHEYGGGDNITALIIAPPVPISPSQLRSVPNESNLVKAAWWGVDTPLAAPPTGWLGQLKQKFIPPAASPETVRDKLIAHCKAKAAALQKEGHPQEAEKYLGWAARLGGSPAVSEADITRARELYESLGMDFYDNYPKTQEILAIYAKAPDNLQLREWAGNAAVGLADLAIKRFDEGGKDREKIVWDAFRLVQPFYDNMEPTQRQLYTQQIEPVLNELKGRLLAVCQQILNESVRKKAWDRLLGCYSSDFFLLDYASFAKRLHSKSVDSGKKITRAIRRYAPIWGTIAFIIALCCIIGMMLVASKFSLPVIPTPVPTSALATVTPTLTISSTMTPTLQPTPSSEPLAPIPTGTFTLTIGQIIANAQNVPGGRRQVNLKIPVYLAFDPSFRDLNARIELEITPSANQAPDGTGWPEPVTKASVPVIQQLSLGERDPRDPLVFDSNYIVDWPRSTLQVCEFLVNGRFIASNGQELARTDTFSTTLEISYTPALEANWVVTSTPLAYKDPITYMLTLRNTGETYIDRVEVNWENVELGLPLSGWHSWQSAFAGIMLQPGEIRVVTLTATITKPEPLVGVTSAITIKGFVSGSDFVEARTPPVMVNLYARGITGSWCNTVADCAPPHPLRPVPGYRDIPTTVSLPDDITVWVQEAKLSNDNNAYYYHLWTFYQGKWWDGWLASTRVSLDVPELKKEYFEKPQ